jgi:predicted ribosome quality control (RQC) complex YloA/Tae2 family protein
MRKQMSAFDIRAAVRELAFIEGSFLDNVYQTAPDELIIKFKVPREKALQYPPFKAIVEDGGSRYATAELRVRAGRWLHLLSRAVEKPQAPSTFAVRFRRQLSNAFVGLPEQPGLERIVRLPLEKATGFTLVMEMFGDGNIILVEEGKIVLPMRSQQWRGRKLSSGEEYAPPPEPADPFSMDRGELMELMAGSGKDLVRCLAVEANLSGAYAEEVIRRAGVDKGKAASELDEDEAGRVADSVASLIDDFGTGKAGVGVLGEDGALVEVHPGGMLPAPAGDAVEFATFNLAVEALADTFSEKEAQVLPGAPSSRVEETRRMARQQEEAVERYGKEAVVLKARGDAIYEHYSRCEEVLKSVIEAKERLGWDEVKKRLAASDESVTADPSTGKVRLEVAGADGPVELELDIRLDLNGNANRLYEASKKARSRSRGARKALAATTKKLAKLEAAEAARAPMGGAGYEALSALDGVPAAATGHIAGDGPPTGVPESEEDVSAGEADALRPPPRRRQRRRFWFEDFRWFITSSGNIAAGGRDAGGNDKVVKRHLQDLDRYTHADVHGASSVVLKSAGGETPDADSLEEACAFAVLHSRAWDAGYGGGTAYWVLPEQVSKTPRAGEALPKGAFIIRGKRNWHKDLPLVVAVTEVEHEGVRLVMAAPLVTVERMGRSAGERRRFVALAPGPVDKNTASRLLASAFRVTEEEVSGVLPSGGVQLVDARGMPQALVDAFSAG